jgi:pimeloyl-ACP methyl ester carboxylesterase
MPRRYIILTRLLKIVGRKNRFPLAQRARRRRNGWTDRAEALEYFREKSLFRNWEEPQLKAYVTFGLMPDATGRVVLVCPPGAEACGFENYPTDIWSWPRRLTVPTLIVRGGDSDALPPKCYETLCRICATENPGTPRMKPVYVVSCFQTRGPFCLERVLAPFCGQAASRRFFSSFVPMSSA